ncbi:MAG TPA: LssY C-terminal domain-containing protein [Gemmataceae bacterium]|nr:LssY C-terminal domain-containing protein [Gemmataceae bacterium]
MQPPTTAILIPPRRRRLRHDLTALSTLLVGYGLASYMIVPLWWQHHAQALGLSNTPMVTHTRSGIPGDPVNVALVGSKQQVIQAMRKAGWDEVDRTTVRSSAKIAESVVLGKSYPTAPVSRLFLFGRAQDLAFQRQVGHSARRRHHVRFWRSDQVIDGRPVWFGAVTYDTKAGFSHRTGQITHHIGPDIDAERNELIAGLSRKHLFTRTYQIRGIGPTRNGKNGGGDRYFTDGMVTVGVLK